MIEEIIIPASALFNPYFVQEKDQLYRVLLIAAFRIDNPDGNMPLLMQTQEGAAILEEIVAYNKAHMEKKNTIREKRRAAAKERWKTQTEHKNETAPANNSPATETTINKIDNASDATQPATLFPTTATDMAKPTATTPQKRTIFKPPTVEEVAAYCREKNIAIDPATFVNFYTSKGWFIGKNKMKDWRAAVRTWARQGREQRPRNSYDIGRTTINNDIHKFDNEENKWER